jgi:hypothetical protein
MTEPAQDVEVGDDVIVHFAGRPESGRPLTVRTGWEGDQYVELPADFAVPADQSDSELDEVRSALSGRCLVDDSGEPITSSVSEIVAVLVAELATAREELERQETARTRRARGERPVD